jgi:hypothetical protein
MAQVIEHLLSKYKALSLKQNTKKQGKKTSNHKASLKQEQKQ